MVTVVAHKGNSIVRLLLPEHHVWLILKFEKPSNRWVTSIVSVILSIHVSCRGVWWLINRLLAFRPKCRGFECHSSPYVWTLGKSLTRSCPWRFGVKLQHSISAVS